MFTQNKMNMVGDTLSNIRGRKQVDIRIGILNSYLGVTLITQISNPDPKIEMIYALIEYMRKLGPMGMVTTVMLVSFTSITTSVNLDTMASLLVGTIPKGRGEEENQIIRTPLV